MVILVFDARDKAKDLFNALADDRIIAVCGSSLDAGARMRELQDLLRVQMMTGFAIDFLRAPGSVCVGFAFDTRRFKRTDARYWTVRSYRNKRFLDSAGPDNSVVDGEASGSILKSIRSLRAFN